MGFASLSDHAALVTLLGIVFTPVLLALRIPGALLLSIGTITVAGLFVRDAHGHGLTTLPVHLFAVPPLTSTLFFAFDFHQFFAKFFVLLPITLYFLLSEFFSGTSTLLAVSRRAGLLTPAGEIPAARAAFSSDALASVIGAALGTSTVTAYVESVTGVESGGRTGMVGVVVAALFVLTLFFAPLIEMVPAQATAPTLVLVGVLMMEGLAGIDMRQPTYSLPPLLMLVVTACTGDLMAGLAIGLFVYSATSLALSGWRRLTPMVLALDGVFVLYLVLKHLVA
jgi:AGZA family xanthine/uracil permease-like MFS transporter